MNKSSIIVAVILYRAQTCPMDILQNFLNDILRGVLSRTDDALYALGAIILLQAAMIVAGHVLKRPVPVYSVVENLCRPAAVFLNDKLNRQNRSDYALIIRGIIVAFLTAAIIFALGIGVEHLSVMAGIGSGWTHTLSVVSASLFAEGRSGWTLPRPRGTGRAFAQPDLRTC